MTLAEDVPPAGKPHPDKSSAGKRKGKGEDRIVIKKYANRRLYNTGSSSYVTLEDLSELVKSGDDFVVYDAKTGEDITRPVLTQIIFEAENSSTGQNLLPIQFLRQLIRLYGDQMQSFVPSYLEMSLDAFSKQQERMREHMAGTFGATPGFGLFDEQVKQNLALFDRAIKMFTPSGFPGRAGMETPASSPAPDPKPDDLADLKSQIEAMRAQIDKLAASKG
jgi:polyhydroxyalkanoate synthesis repressor PhaR